MGFVAAFVEDVGDIIGDTFEAVGDIVEDTTEFIGDAIEKIGDTIEAIVEDPLPTLLMIAGSAVGIPPYVTSAIITAARGGDLGDIALSAGTAYLGAELGGQFQTSSIAGSLSSTLVESGVDTAIASTVTTSIGKGLVNGAVAELKGGDFVDGFTGGLVGSVVGAGVQEVTSIVSDAFATTATEAVTSFDGTTNNDIVTAFDNSSTTPANVDTTVNTEFDSVVQSFNTSGATDVCHWTQALLTVLAFLILL